MEKFCRARQATDDSMVHLHCMLDSDLEYVVLISLILYSVCTNMPQFYVVCTLPVLLIWRRGKIHMGPCVGIRGLYTHVECVFV